MLETILFYLFAATSVTTALLVISRVNPLMSALWLVVCLASSAGLFALLSAPFLAIIQILVYAGAVMVLFLFVIMLIDISKEALKPRVVRFAKVVAVSITGYFTVIVCIVLWRPSFLPAPLADAAYGDVKVLGKMLLTDYAVPFELASLLLLAAMIGAVVMGKKKL
ncbi:MAG: NADH-quinone oxidoreductase subunit J [Deltaproteobacteria bacterium]|nr:NADH-quinone oxidoreductase subunit J [Deltaproteobacteria bacterium]